MTNSQVNLAADECDDDGKTAESGPNAVNIFLSFTFRVCARIVTLSLRMP